MGSEYTRSTGDKVRTLMELASISSDLKAQGKHIVHSHGVFDLMHPGHIRHLEAAKREGNVLVVTVTPDQYVDDGPGRPVFNQRLRAETLASLQCVDFVAVNDWPTAVETIRLLRPDVYVRGIDHEERDVNLNPKTEDEEEVVLSVGGRLHLTQDITFSSKHLLNTYFEPLSTESDAWLREFRRAYTADDVVSCLKRLATLKVLVVGDAIIDEYHFCRPYGMASKSSAIAAQYQNMETYAGGALAVANHLAGFCKEVHLVTSLGEQDSRKEFISQSLMPTVSTKFFLNPAAPTVIKRRYVQPFLTTKLFEVSFFNDEPLPPKVEQQFCSYLDQVIGGYDLVVVADFGHGLLGPAAVEVLCQRASYLAVNVQLNSINHGYNLITKYARAHYVCIDEEETRMACQDRYAPLEGLIEQLARRLNCQVMTVTRGHLGSLTYLPGQGFVSVPALSSEVVDTMGAGDAYLAITAPCACLRYSPDLIGFVGNAVGALAVRIIGNKEPVEPVPLSRFISTLLT